MAMTVTAKKEVMEQEGTKALHKARKVYDNEPTIDEWKPQKWNLWLRKMDVQCTTGVCRPQNTAVKKTSSCITIIM